MYKFIVKKFHNKNKKNNRRQDAFLRFNNNGTKTECAYPTHGASRFYGFSCGDANLRNEGCFFYGVGLPKLASEQDGTGEETKGAALASRQGF